MIFAGLTGGIASGKSTASRFFKSLGANIIDADLLAREVVEPQKDAWLEIVEEFGPGVLMDDGSINRERLGDIIFSDPGKRERLNRIVHPRIREAEETLLRRFKEHDEVGVAILDAALLIEVGSQKRVDKVIIVWSDEETQVRRLMDRDGISREKAMEKLKSQMPLRAKLPFADYIIDNGKDLSYTKSQVEEIYRELLEMARAKQDP